MAGKSANMSRIKQVLQLSENGVSNRQIARDLDINKETVNNYVRFFNQDSLTLKQALSMEDPELEARFRAGNPAYTDHRHQTFLDELPHFRTSLGHKHVTRFLVWQEYIARHPDGYRKSQFFHHLKQQLAASVPTTVLSDTYVPGEKLYVDFAGDTLEYVNTETGEIRSNIFYCDAQMPSQKPHVENNHEFIRDIILKKKSMSNLTQDKLDLMFSHINSVPRKSLGGKTPYEAFEFFYGKDTLDKLNIQKIKEDEVTLQPYLLQL